MKISLVYPPNTYLEAPPLGISYLKGYLLKHLEGIQIKNVDLNLYYDIYDNLILGLCDSCPKRNVCAYFKSSASGINLFHREQKICANRLFKNLIGANVFLNNNNDSKAVRYLFDRFGDYLSLIAASKPEVIGISLADYSQVVFGLFLAKCIRKTLKKCYLILGGSFINHCSTPENIMKFKFVDFCIYGDGERPLRELLEKLGKEDNSFEDVPNLIYRKGKKIIKNKREYFKTFSELPYPVFDNIQRYQAIPILQSFGCPYGRCAFCSYFKDGRFQLRQIDDLIGEIKRGIKNYKNNVFVFWDNSITAERMKLISSALIKNRLKITYRAMCRPCPDFNPDILKIAFQSGCRYIFWGIESTNQRILNLMRKDFSISYAREVLKMAKAEGIVNSINIMLFFPTQTKKELLADIRFLIVNHHLFEKFNLSFYYLEKGDFIYRHLKQFHIERIKKMKLYNCPSYTDYNLYNHYAVDKPMIKSNNGIFRYCYSNEDVKTSKDLLQAEYFYVLGNYKKSKAYLYRYLQHNASNNIFFLFGLGAKEFRGIGQAGKEFKPQEVYKNTLRGFKNALNVENARAYFDNLHFPLSRENIDSTVNFINGFLRLKFAKDYKNILLSQAYYYLRQYGMALKQANKAKKTLFDEIDTYFLIGLCYEKLKKYGMALKAYREGLGIFPNNQVFYLGLTICYFNLRRYNQAIETANKLVKLDYKEGNIHLLLGLCYQNVKQYKKAIKEFKKAQKLRDIPMRAGDKFISYLNIKS